MEKITKKELINQIDILEKRVGSLETQVKTLASVFKGMLEVAQKERSVIEKPVIEVIN